MYPYHVVGDTCHMPIEFKIKAVKVGNSLRMTVPKEIAEALGLKAGDTLGVSLTDSEMIVRRLPKPK